jgi:hypothetical protein
VYFKEEYEDLIWTLLFEEKQEGQAPTAKFIKTQRVSKVNYKGRERKGGAKGTKKTRDKMKSKTKIIRGWG